jgi:hypothetical protein
MKKLLFVFLVLAMGSAQGQNLVNQQISNPPTQVPDNNQNPQVQVAQNINEPEGINTLGNLSNSAVQQALNPADVQQVKQKRVKEDKVYSEGNSYLEGNEPKWKFGQYTQNSSSGYSRSSRSSSGSSHKSKKSFDLKFKKALKIFEKKYKATNHYGHKGRIKKCHKF